MRFLASLTPAYALAQEARRFFYRRLLPPPAVLPALVVSVGNITAGGTGKTTVAAYLARFYADRGGRVAVIGHGVGGNRRVMVVSDGRRIRAGLRRAGDEALLLARLLPGIPVVSGRYRDRAARLALRLFRADTIILDDAFHDLRLARDLDIVVFNCRLGLGDGRLLPAGRLREPPRALARAGILWLNHSDALPARELESLRRKLLQYNPSARVVESFYRYRSFVDLKGRRYGPEELRGRRVRLVAGIGDPEMFARRVRALGVTVAGKTFYPDHHVFRPREIASLSLSGVDFVLITEKDRVRFPAVSLPVPVLYPEIELVVKGFDADAGYPGGRHS